MDTKASAAAAVPPAFKPQGVATAVLAAISVSHLLNDLIQSMIPALYPLIKETYRLDFARVGLITLALLFDFINGLHDAANSIATIVSTRVLRPQVAVAWAAFFNFIAFLF